METVKYAFGETPSEVIREAMDGRNDAVGIHRDSSGTLVTLGADALHTVLDALLLAAEQGPGADERFGVCGWSAEARHLRIEILAALGIDESGAEPESPDALREDAIEACKAVVDSWESGNLADAARQCQAVVDAAIGEAVAVEE